MMKRTDKYFLLVATLAILATVASGAPYLGDFVEDETVHFIWSTNDADGAAITRATDGSILVFKDNATSGTTKGVTDSEDFNSVTGIHACTIDTSADAFYATGADYSVVLSAATIDSQTVNTALAHFSILNRYMRGTDSSYTGTPPTAVAIAAAVMEDAATSAALATAQADLDNPTQYKATGFSTHSAADVWTATTRTITSAGSGGATAEEVWTYGTRALSTPDDYKATGFSTHSAADVWSASGRELSTPADYKADVSGLATASALATAQTDLDNPDQYKATGFSTHSAVDVWAVVTRTLSSAPPTLAQIWEYTTRTLTSAGSGGATAQEVWEYGTRALSTPADYKADVSGLATASALATAQADLDNPTQYKATGFSTHSAADNWTYTTRTLSSSAGGDASAANQTSILAALTDIEGTGYTSATHSLVALRTRGDSAWVTGSGGTAGAGGITTTYTLTSAATGLPIADASVWATTDSAGANVAASGTTDDFGKVVFYLDAGTFYFFRKKAGFSFVNPDTVEVSE